MKEDSTLIAEIREQVLYMQELGLKAFGVDFPEIIPIEANVKQLSTPEKSLDYYVPPEFIRVKTETKTIEAIEKSPVKSEMLSRLPSLGDRANISKLSKKTIPSAVEMTKKSTELTPTQTIFGDTSKSLPETTETLIDIQNAIGKDCQRCRLCENRTQVVNSVGNPNAELMFIGEAPGADEDAKGEPFVGRAGQLLTKIIEAINLNRDEVFIGNINRCRPPQNRQPQLDEAEICKPFLIREIAVVRPKVIVVMGNTSCQNLLDTKVGITKLRGNFQDYYGVKVMPTFHPAYLLRDPHKKREVWEDMKKVRDFLNSF